VVFSKDHVPSHVVEKEPWARLPSRMKNDAAASKPLAVLNFVLLMSINFDAQFLKVAA